MLPKNDREKLRKKIASNVMVSREVVEYLDISRTRLSQYVGDGRIEPIITGRSSIYLKDDIIAFKRDHLDKLDKDQRMRNKQ